MIPIVALLVVRCEAQSILRHVCASVDGRTVAFGFLDRRTFRRKQQHALPRSFIGPSTCIILKHQQSRKFYCDKQNEIPNHCKQVQDDNKNTTYRIDHGLIYRFRGIVETGYGRGGKKLGFPTANIGPAAFFNETALANHISTGVYFGHALIEQPTASHIINDKETSPSIDGSSNKYRNVNDIYKTVVNIGYSPTFVGQENKMKIIEAHFILPEDTPLNDFYNVTIRLQLLGFLRPELKFASFPDLIQQITNDISTAQQLLETQEPYVINHQNDQRESSLQHDPFFTLDPQQPWIGRSGGNSTASYEIFPLQEQQSP